MTSVCDAIRPDVRRLQMDFVLGFSSVLLVSTSALLIPIQLKALLQAASHSAVVNSGEVDAIGSGAVLRSTVITAGLFIINAISGYVQGVSFHKIGVELASSLRQVLLERWLSWPPQRHQAYEVGRLVAISSYDVQACQNALTVGIAPLLQNMIAIVGGIALLSYYSPVTALMLLALVSITGLVLSTISSRVVAFHHQSQKALETATAILESAISGIADVRNYGAAPALVRQFAEILSDVTWFRLEAQRRQTITGQVLYGLFATLVLLVFAGQNFGLKVQSSTPEMLIIFLLCYTCTQAMISFHRTLGVFREAWPALRRVQEHLQLETGRADGWVLPSELDAGTIELDRVTVRYSGASQAAIESVTLSVEAGQWVVITGPSGSGKSTLLAALTGAVDSSGTVRVAGHPIAALSESGRQSAIAIAGTQPLILPGSLIENVRFFRQHVTDSDVVTSLQMAQLPTSLSFDARGANLSSGQRARVGIARALAARPRILAFDESTAPLDAATEAAFWTALYREARDTTVIIVTHRPERIPNASRIIRLRDGELETSYRS